MALKKKFTYMLVLKDYIENLFQLNGKKIVSEKILFTAIKLLQKKTLKKINDVIILFIFNHSFLFNIKVLKKKKKKYIYKFVPFFLIKKKRVLCSLKTIIGGVKKKLRIKTFIKVQKILLNTLDNSNNNNDFLSIKQTLHKAAYIKKSFFHYRWF